MRSGASYVIDRAAPLRPPAAQVQAWAEDKRVFASSVIPGLKECRAHAKAAITKVGALAVMFETFGGKEDPPDIAYLSEVGRSDIYVGILDIPYGRVQENGISATHDEYREAERIGLPISVWVTTSTKDERQQALVEEVRELHTTGSYSTLDELERGIETRLVEMASEELSPWVKVGKAIFRASTVLETSGRVVIEGVVRDHDLLAELRTLRIGLPHLGSGPVSVSYGGRTLHAAPEDFQETTRPGVTRDVRLTLKVLGAPQHAQLNASLAEGGKTYTASDLAEIAIRRAVNDPDLAADRPRFMADIGQPWADLASQHLPEDSIGPIAWLLLTDALVGSGTASALPRFRLGPLKGDIRRLKLEWIGATRYSGDQPERHSFDGNVSWPRRSVAQS